MGEVVLISPVRGVIFQEKKKKCHLPLLLKHKVNVEGFTHTVSADLSPTISQVNKYYNFL